MAASLPDLPVPVTILTGFLGAGKTTLLNRILNSSHGLRVAVLVNDFGSVNIDAELVIGVEDNVISLANGCVCCSIRDDLIESIDAVFVQQPDVDYIILEASGVSEPLSIATTFHNPTLRDRLRIDSITCVVDTEQILDHQDYPAFTRLKLLQIGCADLVILNKVDHAGSAQVQRVRDWIAEHLNRVRLLETSHCDVPLELLLSAGRYDAAQQLIATRDPVHSREFSTWSYRTDRQLSVEALREMVRRELPAEIIRCKGIVQTAEHPDNQSILQVVGRRTDITTGEPWNGQAACTSIVSIGVRDSLHPAHLQKLFDACVVGSRHVPT